MVDLRKTLIQGGRILEPERHRSDAADILIFEDRIMEVSKPGMIVPDGADVIDAHNHLLHPGLINAHTHGHHSLDKATKEGWTLEQGIAILPWINAGRSHEILKLTATLAAAEMALKGCTACYDLNLGLPSPSADGTQAIAEGYAEVGIRAVIAPMLANRTLLDVIPGLLEALPSELHSQVANIEMATYEQTTEGLRHALSHWPFDPDQFRLAVAPTMPLHCSSELLKACGQLAKDFDTGLHSHVAESKIQALLGLDRYGKSVTAHLETLDLLGPNFVAAQGIWLDRDDMKRLADHGASVAHCPSSNMLLSNGLADVRALLDAQVNVGIGTDGMRSNDNENMYQEVRMASLVSKVQTPEPDQWITTGEAYHAATAGGSKLLGLDDIGTIKAGAKADIVFLDLHNINWIPRNEPIHQLVHVEEGTSVDAVMIGGKMIVENGNLTSIDMEKLARDIATARTAVAVSQAPDTGVIDRVLESIDHHCSQLARQPFHIDRYAAGSGD